MSLYRTGSFEIDPIKQPAVADTATWDEDAAYSFVRSAPEIYWKRMLRSLYRGDVQNRKSDEVPFSPLPGSVSRRNLGTWMIGRLPDGQHLILSMGKTRDKDVDIEAFKTFDRNEGQNLTFYPASDRNIHTYLKTCLPGRASRGLGARPRLGIGVRPTVLAWPAIWQAMAKKGFCANAIQNSLRELNLLEDLRSGHGPRENHQFSFGSVQEGHTGSTFEGLWLSGALSALDQNNVLDFGADADHIMVKKDESSLTGDPGPLHTGRERARQIILAARHYSFYTLDVSDLLDFTILHAKDHTAGTGRLEQIVGGRENAGMLLEYHNRDQETIEEELLGRYVAKYWEALDALEGLAQYIADLKGDEPFDLELSIDENPPGIETCSNTTSVEELSFLIRELLRRDIPVTHIAPNFGIEKGTDFRCPEGIIGLQKRVKMLCDVAGESGFMLDCHSGDDLSAETMRAIGDASSGWIQFKVSPSLQVLLGECIHDVSEKLFGHWWRLSLAYARRKQEEGSELAGRILGTLEGERRVRPSADHPLFHHFCFGPVGERDKQGRFINREWFYDLPQSVKREYTRRLTDHLCNLSEQIFR